MGATLRVITDHQRPPARAPGPLGLILDGNNVIGARPDGWWRDRPGAAARLAARLGAVARTGVPGERLGLPAATATARWWPEVVLVLEGAARSAPDPDAAPSPGSVVVRRARREGDDEIVAVTSELRATRPDDAVVVVTADRGLRARVVEAGALVVGPRALDEADPP